LLKFLAATNASDIKNDHRCRKINTKKELGHPVNQIENHVEHPWPIPYKLSIQVFFLVKLIKILALVIMYWQGYGRKDTKVN
jgi:hypothetical protein